MRNWLNELVDMLEEKARELFGEIAGEKWAARIPEVVGEMSSPRWGFSAKRPASPPDLREVISFMEERELLTDEKPDETFTSTNIERAQREVALDCVVAGRSGAEVVCQCPTHRGAAPLHLPKQKYIVVDSDGRLVRMCHRDTSVKIISGGFMVDLATGKKVWYFCQACARFAKNNARAQGGRLTLYRLREALDVADKVRQRVEKERMIAARIARSAEQSKAIVQAASAALRGKPQTSSRARANNWRARGMSAATEADFGGSFNPTARLGGYDRHRHHLG